MEKKYEIGHIEIAVPLDKDSRDMRAYGAEYDSVVRTQTKYIITTRTINSQIVTRFDSMVLNFCNNPKKDGKKFDCETYIQYHSQIMNYIFSEDPEYFSRSNKECRAFVDAFIKEHEHIEDNLETRRLFEEAKSHPDNSYLDWNSSIKGGYVSYDRVNNQINLYGKSGDYGKPENEDLTNLGRFIIQAYNELLPVQVLGLEDRVIMSEKSFNTRINDSLTKLNEEYVMVNNFSIQG